MVESKHGQDSVNPGDDNVSTDAVRELMIFLYGKNAERAGNEFLRDDAIANLGQEAHKRPPNIELSATASSLKDPDSNYWAYRFIWRIAASIAFIAAIGGTAYSLLAHDKLIIRVAIHQIIDKHQILDKHPILDKKVAYVSCPPLEFQVNNLAQLPVMLQAGAAHTESEAQSEIPKLVVITANRERSPDTSIRGATRTWVSGTGDDLNPCTVEQPCKTFAGAIAKTPGGGEINFSDPGGFGGITITNSTRNFSADNVLRCGTNVTTIYAHPTDIVRLNGLVIDGVSCDVGRIGNSQAAGRILVHPTSAGPPYIYINGTPLQK
jgi:hypothetical protein